MSASSDKDGFAYLRIRSQLPLAAIEEHMGSASTRRSWDANDKRKSRPNMQYGFSMWSLGSGLEKGVPLDAHLTSLWRRIESIQEEVLTVPAEMKLTLQCVAHFAGQKEAFSISAGHFATAAYYRLDWDFDFYFDDDFGCEAVAQPYWKW